MHRALHLALAAALTVGLALTACNKATDDTDDSTAHDEDRSGAMHAAGKEDPLANCVGCHGSDLRGAGEAPSCYDCHEDADHTVSRSGVMHGSGTCSNCHGPGNSGGLGPACDDCH